MPKRKKSNLWLKKPKRRHFPRFVTPKKGIKILTPKQTAAFSTPTKAGRVFKRLLTPESLPRAIRKKLHIHESPKNKFETVLNENVIFDEFEETITEEYKEYIDIASDKVVMKKLSEAGLLYYFVLFFQLVKAGKYSLSNIAMLLWLETVRWFSLETCQQMWYWETTKMFWRAGYRLFHGKFLTFMSGPKGIGKFLDQSSTKKLSPESTEINFAVPSRTSILDQSNNLIPNVIHPGVISETLDAIKSISDVNMMCVDGKKVTAGLDEDFGDVNVFGFEEKPSIGEKKERLKRELQLTDDLKSMLFDSQFVDEDNKHTLMDMLRALIYLLTVRLKEVRDLKNKQEFGLEKLKERAGSLWKESKYIYAISGIQAFLYKVRQCIKTTLGNIGNLCELGASISEQGYNFCVIDMDPSNQQNMFLLKEIDDQTKPIPTNLIKQKSELWKSVRSLAYVTGSTLHSALGLRGLKEQKTHFDVSVLGKKPAEVSAITQKYLDHGTHNEKHAVATLSGKFLPIFYPKLNYVEEGCYLVDGQNKTHLLEVSPDGSLKFKESVENNSQNNRTLKDKPILAVEIKCPFNGNVHYKVPTYYICQCLAEMSVLGVQGLIYACYTAESTTFFHLEFDSSLWNLIQVEMEDLYDSESPVRRSKLSDKTKVLKQKLETYTETKVQLLAEIPSIKMKECRSLTSEDDTPYFGTVSNIEREDCENMNIVDRLQMLLMESEECLKTGHQLSRRKANEVLVWVLSNKDRLWSSELPNSVPIAYGLKDYKFSAEAMRKACNYVLGECARRGLKIPLLAFDGQWCSLMVRDSEGEPLTQLQLQKDVWNSVAKLKKNQIIDKLTLLNTVNIDISGTTTIGIVIEKSENRLTVTSTDHAFRTVKTNYSSKFWKENKTNDTVSTTETEGCYNISAADWIPDSVIQAIESNGDMDLINMINTISKEVDGILTKEGHS